MDTYDDVTNGEIRLKGPKIKRVRWYGLRSSYINARELALPSSMSRVSSCKSAQRPKHGRTESSRTDRGDSFTLHTVSLFLRVTSERS